jgi:hypothetical protein
LIEHQLALWLEPETRKNPNIKKKCFNIAKVGHTTGTTDHKEFFCPLLNQQQCIPPVFGGTSL